MGRPAGGVAVMQRRLEPKDSLDDFPTPPWGTRALCEMLEQRDHLDLRHMTAWEPCANRRIMADPLGEYFGRVVASDVHEYGFPLDAVGSFVGEGLALDAVQWPLAGRPDWIITNPPFRLASAIILRALVEAETGVAMLVRSAWLEGAERYAEIFGPRPPATIAIFSERLPMVRGRWDVEARSATSYAWVVWRRGHAGEPSCRWFAPGTRDRLTRPDDAATFGYPSRGDPPDDDPIGLAL